MKQGLHHGTTEYSIVRIFRNRKNNIALNQDSIRLLGPSRNPGNVIPDDNNSTVVASVH